MIKKIIKLFCDFRFSFEKLQECKILEHLLNENEFKKFLNKSYDELVVINIVENDFFRSFETITDVEMVVNSALFKFLSRTLHFVKEGTNIIETFQIDNHFCSMLYFDCSLNRHSYLSAHFNNLLIKSGYQPSQKDNEEITKFKKVMLKIKMKNAKRRLEQHENFKDGKDKL